MYYSLTLIKSTYYNLSQSQRALGAGVERKWLYFLNHPELSAAEIKNDFWISKKFFWSSV